MGDGAPPAPLSCDLLPWRPAWARRIVGRVNASDHNIVVGVDGSESSAALLQWARDFALQAGARLKVVLAWRPPDLASLVSFRVERSLVETAERRLIELVQQNTRGVDAEAVVMEGSPSRALLESAKDADYLVIGRPDGVDPGPPVSVAAYCVTHSSCPVIVVPVPKAAAS